MKRAYTSLPVPLSPVMSTVASFSAILRARHNAALRLRIDRDQLVRRDAQRQLTLRHLDQGLRVERLDDVVGRALAHGGHRLRDRAVGGHQHHRQIRPQPLDRRQQLVAVGPGHLHVRDHQGDLLARQQLQGALRIVRRPAPQCRRRAACRPTPRAARHRPRPPEPIRSSCSCIARSPLQVIRSRRWRRNSSSARLTLPPCASTTDLTIESPMPLPRARVVKKGSKMRCADLRRHAGTIVAHHDLRAPVRRCGAPAVPDSSVAGCRLQRVGGQIQHRRHQRRCIGAHHQIRRLGADGETDPVAQCRPQPLRHLLQQRAHAHRPRAPRRHARTPACRSPACRAA